MHANVRTPAALLLALILSSCTSFSKPVREPRPPLIECGERKARTAIPALPATGASVAWQRYALRLLGLLEERDTLAAETADCLDQQREEGVIR